MRFELSPGLFEPAVEDHLRREIIGFAVEGRHNVVIQPAAQAAFDGWRGEQSVEVQDEIDLAVGASVEEEALRPHRLAVVVGGSEADDWNADPPHLSTRAARDLGRQALRVFVEDFESDRAFLLGVVPPAYLPPLRQLLDERWAELVHGGGSRLGDVVEQAAQDSRQRSRSFVFFDSDALEPGRPSAAADHLRQLCARLGLAHHCLERRESENYLPPQAVHRWAFNRRRQRRLRAQAWFRLSPVQRHHFDMKAGFGGGDPPALYADVPLADRRSLRSGFGAEIWREFREINPDWVERDGQLPELTTLFAALMRLR